MYEAIATTSTSSIFFFVVFYSLTRNTKTHKIFYVIQWVHWSITRAINKNSSCNNKIFFEERMRWMEKSLHTFWLVQISVWGRDVDFITVCIIIIIRVIRDEKSIHENVCIFRTSGASKIPASHRSFITISVRNLFRIFCRFA